MLQNKDLLPHPTQRLGAIYLLFDMYRNELNTHPFASVFVHLLVCAHFSNDVVFNSVESPSWESHSVCFWRGNSKMYLECGYEGILDTGWVRSRSSLIYILYANQPFALTHGFPICHCSTMKLTVIFWWIFERNFTNTVLVIFVVESTDGWGRRSCIRLSLGHT